MGTIADLHGNIEKIQVGLLPKNVGKNLKKFKKKKKEDLGTGSSAGENRLGITGNSTVHSRSLED